MAVNIGHLQQPAYQSAQDLEAIGASALGPQTVVVLRADADALGEDWDPSLLEDRIAGIPLLRRHLISYSRVGVKHVRLLVGKRNEEWIGLVGRCRVNGVDLDVVTSLMDACSERDGQLVIQRADTLIDPKLLVQLSSMPAPEDSEECKPRVCSLVVLDRFSRNYDPEEKSPYRVGVPSRDEATLGETHRAVAGTENGAWPVGLQLDLCADGGGEVTSLHIGRYYWHRIRSRQDVRIATRKVLLATMKPTDGIYARTNRRVSLAISRVLVDTPVTANVATVFTFVFSLASGFAFAAGTYPFVVLGAFLSWFASMLDGVDGELARSKFSESDFGCWLEMVCDYLYYIVVFAGIGIGIFRMTGNHFWLVAGFGSVFGVLLSFWAVAHQRKRYSKRAPASDFGREFQVRIGAQKQNPVYRFSRLAGFLATRAALPYFIFLFSVLGLVKLLLCLIFFGTNLAWLLLLYASRLFRH